LPDGPVGDCRAGLRTQGLPRLRRLRPSAQYVYDGAERDGVMSLKKLGAILACLVSISVLAGVGVRWDGRYAKAKDFFELAAEYHWDKDWDRRTKVQEQIWYLQREIKVTVDPQDRVDKEKQLFDRQLELEEIDEKLNKASEGQKG